MEHHKNFPSAYERFILRDIFNYNDQEIGNLGLVDYDLAMHYALETYIRRDVLYIMSNIYGSGKKGGGKEDMKITIAHPEIEAYIKEQYAKEEPK